MMGIRFVKFCFHALIKKWNADKIQYSRKYLKLYNGFRIEQAAFVTYLNLLESCEYFCSFEKFGYKESALG